MNQWDETVYRKFELVLEQYVDAYFVQRDPDRVNALLMDTVHGFGTGLDETIFGKAQAVALFRRDMESAPDSLHATFHQRKVVVLDEHNAIANCVLDLETSLLGQWTKLINLRLLLVFHEEGAKVLIAALHISFPTEVHEPGESFPLMELENRAHLLRRMVDSETKSLQEAYREMSDLINEDTLTGIGSRYYIEAVLKKEYNRYRRFRHRFALIFLDLDDFKAINDSFGHQEGDAVLKGMADMIRKEVRSTDAAGRWGGDEFLLVLPETGPEEAEGMASRLLSRFQARQWPLNGTVTVSIGVICVREDEDEKALFKRVDLAMYRAKKLGKNRVVVE